MLDGSACMCVCVCVCSNLLRPAGIQLRPATFTLKLYRAEDIPRSECLCLHISVAVAICLNFPLKLH